MSASRRLGSSATRREVVTDGQQGGVGKLASELAKPESLIRHDVPIFTT